MALVVRNLRATITLAAIAGQAQSFTNSGGADTLVVEQLRMSAVILHAGGQSDGTLELVIYGLSDSVINKLATLGMRLNNIPKNLIVLEAGDDQSGMSTVFTGFMVQAVADFNAQPEVSLRLSAHTLAPQLAAPAKATSFPGSADVATMMAGFASLMGFKFENNGVTTVLTNQYFSGSVKTQAQECVDAAGISWNHGEGGVLAIWPKFGSRGGSIPLISAQTGMLGYPVFSALGVDVKMLFNRSVGLGGQVQVQSSLQAATGQFAVYSLMHELDCELPGGKWFTTAFCYNPKLNNASGT